MPYKIHRPCLTAYNIGHRLEWRTATQRTRRIDPPVLTFAPFCGVFSARLWLTACSKPLHEGKRDVRICP